MENVKIKKIDVENLKAVSSFTALFEGKSAHVTGANGFGKSTVIRALTDRLRGLKPSIITKIGESQGKTVMELTDGCRFEWEYNEKGKDHLNYFTPDTFKPVRRDVFKAICNQYFPNQFDINTFLTTTEPAKRLKLISELVNVDLTEVQAKYKNAFNIRADAKKELKILEAQIKPKPETQTFEGQDCIIEQGYVDEIELEIVKQKTGIETEGNSLNTLYAVNKAENEAKERDNQHLYKSALEKWLESESRSEDKIFDFNNEQQDKIGAIEHNKQVLYNVQVMCEGSLIGDFVKHAEAEKFINELPKPEDLKTFKPTTKPELTALNLPDPMPSDSSLNALKGQLIVTEDKLIEAKNELELKKLELSESNTAKQVYDLQLEQFNDFQKDVAKKDEYVQECEKDVFVIHEEIKAIISKTKLPEEFQIDLTNKNDILFKTSKDAEYLPITIETLASSAIFIAAFKLQANYLEAFRVAHFDVSYLDYENRERVLKEAIAMNIQLITESPAYDEKSRELQCKITEE